MKRNIIVLLIVAILIIIAVFAITIPLNSTTGISSLETGNYIIREMPENPDYNGHQKTGNVSSEVSTIGKPWEYQINGLGLDWKNESDKVLIEQIEAIQKKLKNNEYFCFIENDVRHLVLPWQLVLQGEIIVKVSKDYELDQIKLKGYELTEVIGRYEYLQEEIVFLEDIIQEFEIDYTRFYPYGIGLKNDEGHKISIMADRHSTYSCHVFYHQDTSAYKLLKTDYLDWWIFEREVGFSMVSFQNNSNSQYDLFIREGMTTEATENGIKYDIMTPIWGDDFSAYKEVLDQLGDLTQLDTKLVNWVSTYTDNSAPVLTLQEMK